MLTNSKISHLSTQCMKKVNGGMRWTKDRSCNVEDRRPGASPVWMQKIGCYISSLVPDIGDKWFD
jgi:hypothetical protein